MMVVVAKKNFATDRKTNPLATSGWHQATVSRLPSVPAAERIRSCNKGERRYEHAETETRSRGFVQKVAAVRGTPRRARLPEAWAEDGPYSRTPALAPLASVAREEGSLSGTARISLLLPLIPSHIRRLP